MSDFEEKKHGQTPPYETPTAPPAAEMEIQTPNSGTGLGVSAITRRWKRDDLLERGSLVLRGLTCLFSLLAFIIMASNKHGDWKEFDKYEEYRYVLAIAILSTLYTGVQALRHIHQISTGKNLLQQRTSAMIDFFGDQIISYLLISAASSAVPLTNRMREGADNIFTDSSASAISMEFLAFVALALSALISGYKRADPAVQSSSFYSYFRRLIVTGVTKECIRYLILFVQTFTCLVQFSKAKKEFRVILLASVLAILLICSILAPVISK